MASTSSSSNNDGGGSSSDHSAPAIAAKKDFSEDLQALIPESVLAASRRGLEDALALLLPLEKKCRASNDTHTLKQLCLHMVRLCREHNDWAKLNATLSLINKRRNQSRFAISAVVEEAIAYVEQTPGRTEKVALIETLKEVCEGKMYLEAESARLHLLLALIFESEGRVGDACDVIQDVHVETYGSLSKREKAEYIIQQVRLNLRRKDFVRALIHSRKMNRRTLEEASAAATSGSSGSGSSSGAAAAEGLEAVKVAFYSLMVEYHLLHGRDFWEVANCYYKIYDTALTKSDAEAMSAALRSCIAFVLLSRHNNAQRDMLVRLCALRDAQRSCADFVEVATLFKTEEIVPFPFPRQDAVVAQLQQCVAEALAASLEVPAAHVHSSASTRIGSEMVVETETMSSGASTVKTTVDKSIYAPVLDDCLVALRRRVIEKNVRVLSSYYSQIRIGRAAQMLGIAEAELESFLAEMALPMATGRVESSKAAGKGKGGESGSAGVSAESEEAARSGTTLYLRIDRPAGIVTFARPQTPEAVLSDWSASIASLLHLTETTCHLINRENMVFKA